MREDNNYRSISKLLNNFLVDCIIPNVVKYNDVEEKELVSELPNYTFKGKQMRFKSQKSQK